MSAYRTRGGEVVCAARVRSRMAVTTHCYAYGTMRKRRTEFKVTGPKLLLYSAKLLSNCVLSGCFTTTLPNLRKLFSGSERLENTICGVCKVIRLQNMEKKLIF